MLRKAGCALRHQHKDCDGDRPAVVYRAPLRQDAVASHQIQQKQKQHDADSFTRNEIRTHIILPYMSEDTSFQHETRAIIITCTKAEVLAFGQLVTFNITVFLIHRIPCLRLHFVNVINKVLKRLIPQYHIDRTFQILKKPLNNWFFGPAYN